MLIHAAQVSGISVLFNTCKFQPLLLHCPTITTNAGIIIGRKNVKISA